MRIRSGSCEYDLSMHLDKLVVESYKQRHLVTLT